MQLNPKVWLFLAIGAEVLATGFLKKTNVFTVISWTVFCLVLYLICHYSFSRVLEDMNLSVAYALWCGIGICLSSKDFHNAIAFHCHYWRQLCFAGSSRIEEKSDLK